MTAWRVRAWSPRADVPADADTSGPAALWPAAAQTIVFLDRDRRVIHAGEAVDRVLGVPVGDLAGRPLGLIPRLGGRGRVESLWPDGSVHPLEFTATATVPAGVQLVALREITGEPGSGDRPSCDLKLAAVAASCMPGQDASAQLEHSVLSVAAVLSLDLVGVFERPGPRRRMVLRAGHGWDPGAIGCATVSSAEGSPVGRALAVDDPVILGDLRLADRSVGAARLLHDHAVVSGIEVRIDQWGVLGAYARRRQRFSPDDVDLLRVVAAALERARLEERLRSAGDELARARADSVRAVAEATQASERRTRARIMQLLHDEALQSLLAARQELALAVRRPDRVAQARTAVERAVRELREAVSAVHPETLEPAGLREALHAVVSAQARAAGFEAVLDLAVEPEVDCAPLLLSLTRELTTNVARHAGARELRVDLRAAGGDLLLELRDDGVGIPSGRIEEALADGHIGLASARRRVRALGGELEIASEPGRGTCVRVTLPGRAPAASVHLDGRKRPSGDRFQPPERRESSVKVSPGEPVDMPMQEGQSSKG
jgi:signal transduction histidine kinase